MCFEWGALSGASQGWHELPARGSWTTSPTENHWMEARATSPRVSGVLFRTGSPTEPSVWNPVPPPCASRASLFRTAPQPGSSLGCGRFVHAHGDVLGHVGGTRPGRSFRGCLLPLPKACPPPSPLSAETSRPPAASPFRPGPHRRPPGRAHAP